MFWAHWYAVHGYMAVASNNYTHTTWLRFWGCGSLCHRPLGVPGKERRRKTNKCSVVCKWNLMSLKDYKGIECVPTRGISYIRIRYTFRISTDWQHVGSLVQRAFTFWSNIGIQYVTSFGWWLRILSNLPWWVRSKISLLVLTYSTVCNQSVSTRILDSLSVLTLATGI